jgi:hypothetical protein
VIDALPDLWRRTFADLKAEAAALASQTDNQRQELLRSARRLAKYVAHRLLTITQARYALLAACVENGAIAEHGRACIEGDIRLTLHDGRNDAVPGIRRFPDGVH